MPIMRTIIFILTLCFLFSCKKESNTSSNTSSNELFPNEVGNHWVYKYNDGVSTDDHYIYVDIINTGVLPNGQNATIWTTKIDTFLIGTQYVVADDQKAIFYNAPCWTCTQQMPDERRRYIFPLQVNNKWFTQAPYGDTTKVLSQGALTVPAGTFEKTFQLSKTDGYVTNSFTKDTIWLTPNIGMTKFYQDEYSLGPIPGNGTWELKNFLLK
jgi:hypothetical protein